MINKKKSKLSLIITLCVVGVLIASIVLAVVISFAQLKLSRELTADEAQTLVDETFEALPKNESLKQLFKESEIKVTSVKAGDDKNMIFGCEVTTKDLHKAIKENKSEIINKAYAHFMDIKAEGKTPAATAIYKRVDADVMEILNSAKKVSCKIDIYAYEVEEGKFEIYLSEEVVNACLGNVLKVEKEIDTMTTAYYDGKNVDIKNRNTIRTGIKYCFNLINYNKDEPVVGNFIVKWCKTFAYDFNRNFIEDGKWMYLVKGLGTTLAITGVAGLMGMLLGFVVAIVRCTNELTGKLGPIDKVCRVYLTVIRGTPVMVQLLIIYFVLLLPIGVPKFISAVLCFGLNSGAYVAEIVRGGIMSVDKGQTEAGRSLGFGYAQTMVHFIVPQAFKAVLPSLANEFITLLKESSVAFYIGVADLTQGGLKIRSLTYSSFMPLIAVAIIYLVIVVILTKLVGILERRLRKSDH